MVSSIVKVAAVIVAGSSRAVAGIFVRQKTFAGVASPPAEFESFVEGSSTSSSVQIAAGGEANIYVIGSSNAVWQTWPDQLHLMLQRLGYGSTSQEWSENLTTMTHACWGDKRLLCGQSRAPFCDDHELFEALETPRLGNVGWSSWGYAFESNDDCDASMFREVDGHRISCVNAWNCNPAYHSEIEYAKLSSVADEASKSQITVLANWINDMKQQYTTPKNVCYGEEDLAPEDTAAISVFMLRRLISAIHERNPDVVIGVMAAYPECGIEDPTLPRQSSLDVIASLNAAVKAGLASEPNTVFIDYTFPNDVAMLQTKNAGHPNCRGDKVMATATVEALYSAGFLQRGLAERSSDAAELCEAAEACGELGVGCCQRNPRCQVDQDGSTCVKYSAGKQ